VIFLVDMQSFYASVEKAENAGYRDKPVVVAGDPEKRAGIVLAACPLAKRFGVRTGEWIGTAAAKCPDLIVVKPRMQHYIDVSLRITDILQSFSDLVEPYSIDEQFVDVTGSLKLFGSPETIARRMQSDIALSTGVRARVGISENKVLAKMACDLHAKKNASGIFELRKEDLPEKLWPFPISEMFMIGGRMTAHLNHMGIRTIGDLARMPLGRLQQMLRRRFGRNSDIHGEMLWRIANGVDDSPVSPETHAQALKGIGHMMTLPRDYARAEDIHVVLLELCDLVCQRCRAKGVMGQVVSVFCQGADFDRPTGFGRQMKMPSPANIVKPVYDTAKLLFARHWDGLPVRRVGVSLTDLQPDDPVQLSLFDDTERRLALERAMDRIRERFGQASILRAASLTSAGQARDRAGKIGGHRK
jgi:DNA polymerase-4